MGKVNSNHSAPCFLFGSVYAVAVDYFRFNADDFIRNKIIGIECSGPTCGKSRKQIKSAEKADLRVFLQKMSDV